MHIALLTAALAGPMDTHATVHTLDNGLTVILEEDHRTDAIALHLHYGVGSRDEQPGEYGCAHLFEHLMFEGSAHVPQDKFDEWLTAAGGQNNAYTSEDETAYHETFPSGAIDVALFLESDRMGFLAADMDPAAYDDLIARATALEVEVEAQRMTVAERERAAAEATRRSRESTQEALDAAREALAALQAELEATRAELQRIERFAENLTNQKGVVLQERAEGYAEPHGRDWDALTRIAYPPEHPYHHPVIGTVADIEGFQVDAVVDFWQRHYRPRNAVLGIVGNFDTDEMLAKVEHWFSDVPDTGEPEPRVHETPDLPIPTTNGMITDAVEARTLYAAYRTVPLGHPDEPALDLLGYVLSNGRGTRIDDALYYDKDLTFDVGAFSTMSELEGHFIVYAETDRPLDDILARAEKVIARIQKKTPTEAELDRARRAMRSGILDGLEYPADRAHVLVDCQRLRGTPDCVAADWARYEAVTIDDLVRVAAAYLVPERRVTLSVVPEGDAGAITGAVPVELP